MAISVFALWPALLALWFALCWCSHLDQAVRWPCTCRPAHALEIRSSAGLPSSIYAPARPHRPARAASTFLHYLARIFVFMIHWLPIRPTLARLTAAVFIILARPCFLWIAVFRPASCALPPSRCAGAPTFVRIRGDRAFLKPCWRRFGNQVSMRHFLCPSAFCIHRSLQCASIIRFSRDASLYVFCLAMRVDLCSFTTASIIGYA